MPKPRMRDIEPQIIELYNKDYSVRQVAEKLGVSGCKVSTTLHRVGVIRTVREGLRLAREQGTVMGFQGKTHTEKTKELISMRTKEGMTPEVRAYLSKVNSGRQQSEESKEKKSIAMLKLWADPEYKEETRKRMLGLHHSNMLGNTNALGYRHTKEAKIRMAALSLEKWQNPDFVAKIMKVRGVRPNRPEQFLIAFFRTHSLPFKYVGDGQVILGGKCPDFINIDGKKQLIELFGTYWHEPSEVATKAKHFQQFGFELLVVWEDELDNQGKLLKKVKQFIRRKE